MDSYFGDDKKVQPVPRTAREERVWSAEPDPYASWSLSNRLEMLAFEAQLAHLPRSLIAAIWESLPIERDPRVNKPRPVERACQGRFAHRPGEVHVLKLRVADCE